MTLRRSRFFWFGIFCVGFFALLPFMRFVLAYGGDPPVFLSLVEDDRYYFSRIKEVADGHFFIGNPYYKEHVNDTPPAFFVADWLAAAPQLFGFSVRYTVIINQFVWSIIFFIIVAIFLLELGATRNQAIGIALLSFFGLYQHIMRPVSMQVVFPFFVLFCFTLARLLRDRTFKSAMWLVGGSAINFYIYTYSGQVVAATLAVVCIFLLIKRQLKLKDFYLIFFPTILLILPIIFYTIHQMSTPFYWETLARIGLVATRLPTAGVIIYGVPLLISTGLVWLLYNGRLLKNKILIQFLICIVPALLLAATSNIVFGKELETSTHVGRFMTLVTIIFFGFVIPFIKFKQQRPIWRVGVLVLLCFGFLFLFKQAAITYAFITQDVAYNISNQAYARPLYWLEREIKEPAVILANQDISEFIPGMTKHFVAFYMTASLQILSDQEQIERYLLAQPDIAQVNLESLKNNIRVYAGTGAAIHRYKAINRFVRICRGLYLDKFGVLCGEYTTAADVLGPQYFDSIIKTRDRLAADLSAAYDKYQVQYLLIDQEKDSVPAFVKLFPTKLYDDGRFIILSRD